MEKQQSKQNYDNSALSSGLTIGDIFADYQSQVLANRKRVFSNAIKAGDFRQEVYAQLQAFSDSNRELANKALAEAGKYATQEIERAYNNGIKTVDDNVDNYIKQGLQRELLGDNANEQRKQFFIATTLGNLAGALVVSLQSARQQMLQITSLVDISADNLQREIDTKQRIFLQDGLAGSYNVNGIATELSSVGELQMRQDSQKTLLQSQGDRSEEYGLFLVQISAHPSSCPLCAPWQSKVLVDNVYKNGKPDGKHELLSTAIDAGLFHYNCRHTFIVFVEGYSREDIFDFDKASKRMTAERYAIEQEQRYNERAIRRWKRVASGSMSEIEEQNAKIKIAEWQARQRALEQYAESKRIPFARQYQREAIGGKTRPTLPKLYK